MKNDELDTKTLQAMARLGNEIRASVLAIIHEVAPDKMEGSEVTLLTDALVMCVLTGVAIRFKAK